MSRVSQSVSSLRIQSSSSFVSCLHFSLVWNCTVPMKKFVFGGKKTSSDRRSRSDSNLILGNSQIEDNTSNTEFLHVDGSSKQNSPDQNEGVFSVRRILSFPSGGGRKAMSAPNISEIVAATQEGATNPFNPPVLDCRLSGKTSQTMEEQVKQDARVDLAQDALLSACEPEAIESPLENKATVSRLSTDLNMHGSGLHRSTTCVAMLWREGEKESQTSARKDEESAARRFDTSDSSRNESVFQESLTSSTPELLVTGKLVVPELLTDQIQSPPSNGIRETSILPQNLRSVASSVEEINYDGQERPSVSNSHGSPDVSDKVAVHQLSRAREAEEIVADYQEVKTVIFPHRDRIIKGFRTITLVGVVLSGILVCFIVLCALLPQQQKMQQHSCAQESRPLDTSAILKLTRQDIGVQQDNLKVFLVDESTEVSTNFYDYNISNDENQDVSLLSPRSAKPLITNKLHPLTYRVPRPLPISLKTSTIDSPLVGEEIHSRPDYSSSPPLKEWSQKFVYLLKRISSVIRDQVQLLRSALTEGAKWATAFVLNYTAEGFHRFFNFFGNWGKDTRRQAEDDAIVYDPLLLTFL